jgi:glutamine synthetase
MRSIDNYYLAKEIIACFYSSKGYIACFLPKVVKDCGNGAHAHLSLWKDGKNIMGDPRGRFGLS